MNDKLMYIPNDDKQYHLLLKLLLKSLDTANLKQPNLLINNKWIYIPFPKFKGGVFYSTHPFSMV